MCGEGHTVSTVDFYERRSVSEGVSEGGGRRAKGEPAGIFPDLPFDRPVLPDVRTVVKFFEPVN